MSLFKRITIRKRKNNSSHIFTSFTSSENLTKTSMGKKEADSNSNSKNNKSTTNNFSSSDEIVETDYSTSYSTLNLPPEILNSWILQCQNKFSSIKFIHRDVLIEMGNNVLKSAVCT